MGIKSTSFINRQYAIDTLAYHNIKPIVEKLIQQEVFKLNSMSDNELEDLMDENIADEFTNYCIGNESDILYF